jgi:hypothetical protein
MLITQPRDEFGVITDSRDHSCLIGRAVIADYQGSDGRVHRNGRIVEVIGRVWGYGVTFADYTAGPHNFPITVDLRRGEFILPRRGSNS